MRQLTVSDFIHSCQDFTLPSGGQLFQSVLKVGFHFMWYKQGKNSPTWLIKTNPEKCYSLYHSHPPEWIVNSLGGTEYTLGFKNLTCHPPMASIINANISGAQKYPGFRINLIQKKKNKKNTTNILVVISLLKGRCFLSTRQIQTVCTKMTHL